MKSKTQRIRTLQDNLGRGFGFAAPSSPLAAVAAAAAAASSPPSLALTFSSLKYCCASMNESNEFSHIDRVATTPMRMNVTKYHDENETLNVVRGGRVPSDRNGNNDASSSKSHNSKNPTSHSANAKDVNHAQENVMQRRHMDPLSPISVDPESLNYGRMGLVGLTYIKSKLSNNTTPVVETQSIPSKSPKRTQKVSSTWPKSSTTMNSVAASSRSGSNDTPTRPTTSIETELPRSDGDKKSADADAKHDRNTLKIPLAKHDRYDAAIEAYRRRHKSSTLSVSKSERNSTGGQSSVTIKPRSNSTTIDVASIGTASESGRPSQIRPKGEIKNNVNTKSSASGVSCPQPASQRRAEIIEMHRRKSRSVSLSRTASESSKSCTSDKSILQADRPGRSITGQDKVAKNDITDDYGANKTLTHHMPPRIKADSSATMRQQHKQQTIGSMPTSITRARSLSVPRKVANKDASSISLECVSSSEQSKINNLSLTKSCSFTNRGENHRLSRAEIRKARAREGRHRMVCFNCLDVHQ
ncbi:hypothetical protein ACHAWU_004562 [Discostella pseudostelligera]|uniref:Uncharacterized protein n=1 Tax=Discostella pseudostelligera TaxID=259834 RepID=A0ABD3MT71_9STRA